MEIIIESTNQFEQDLEKLTQKDKLLAKKGVRC